MNPQATTHFNDRRNVYSQDGEDGILASLLGEIRLTGGRFAEFGAWDGCYLSNCRLLVDQGWSGVFIESDDQRYRALEAGFRDNPNVLTLHASVAASGEHSFDRILKDHGVGHIDVLSIDIDGDDLAVWMGIRHYAPAVVIIEYNPTIPFDTHYENPRDAAHGSSALAIAARAREKGYQLVEGTICNLFFLSRQVADEVGAKAKPLEEIAARLGRRLPRYFFGYDGSLLFTGGRFAAAETREVFKHPWGRYLMHQPVPRWLRRHRTGILMNLYVAYSYLKVMIWPAEVRRLWRYYRNKRPGRMDDQA